MTKLGIFSEILKSPPPAADFLNTTQFSWLDDHGSPTTANAWLWPEGPDQDHLDDSAYSDHLSDKFLEDRQERAIL